MGHLVLKFKTWRVARGLEFQIQDLLQGYYMLFINVPHPFSIVLKRFYCSQEVLSKIPKPIENNRKWVRWVYNIAQPQHTTRAHTLTAAFRSCVGLE